MTFGCVSNTILLRSGLYFDLANPRPETVRYEDIAGALSKICRFGGQVPRWYSVAEHSILCAQQAKCDGVDEDGVVAVLMHDATEAYAGDVVKPLKIMLPEYKRVESRISQAIGDRFGIDFEKWDGIIREIDHAMLIAERRIIFGDDGVEWTGQKQVRPLNPTIVGLSPDAAEAAFLRLFHDSFLRHLD